MKEDKIEKKLREKIEKFRNAGIKINKEKLIDESVCLAILEIKLKQHKETLEMIRKERNLKQKEYMKKYRQTKKLKNYQKKYHRKYYKKNSKKILKQIKERKNKK